MKNFTLVLLLFSSLAFSQNGWFEGKAELEQNSWRKHNGPFKALMFLSSEPKKIYLDWNKGKTPQFSDLKVVKPSQHFEAIAVFSGCESNKYSECVIVGDWIIKTHNGDVLGEVKDTPIYSGPSPKIENQLLISTNGVGLGAVAAHKGYTFILTIKDQVSGRKVTLERSVAVGT